MDGQFETVGAETVGADLADMQITERRIVWLRNKHVASTIL
jgi:hypothetical protein